ncbi:LacI family transcriptional regulator [Jiangella aurantiaca]|uniref:LacI family transcriptional regulator n=1 Tax=Jiangella aurantiaca TaxID=2530373 RepID=A0A4R5AGA1_9ACTN|nr:LacI family DNA-binding transcriptional regulator [Jiangella aurantiaca]TDD70655.1 LacI family transcriptional regulator [Jiangella aurantiaca]
MTEQYRRRIRQSDIAKLAGVSQTTVSLVINGRESETVRIPAETRERVLEVARMLGYVADPVARSLAGGVNRLIGVYTFESMFPMDHHDFYHPFLVGIEAQAETRGYDLVLFTSATGTDGGRSIYRDGVNRLRLADGCVLLGKETNRDDIAHLRDEGFSFTLVGRRDIPGDDISYVTADYAAATEQVVDHLVELGHRRIAYLPAAVPSEPADDRDHGFHAARARHDLEVADLVGPVTKEVGISTGEVRALLDAGASAFLAHESVVALQVIQILQELGLDVPGDRSVAALNDPPDGVPGPSLTCFRIPRRELGSLAVDLLISQIEAPDAAEPRTVTLPCTFVAGQTSGPHSENRSRQ